MENVLATLMGKKISKWKIAKELGVHWNTVRMWERGVFKPTESHVEAMKLMLSKQEKNP